MHGRPKTKVAGTIRAPVQRQSHTPPYIQLSSVSRPCSASSASTQDREGRIWNFLPVRDTTIVPSVAAKRSACHAPGLSGDLTNIHEQGLHVNGRPLLKLSDETGASASFKENNTKATSTRRRIASTGVQGVLNVNRAEQA
jgi:hypothetical protein